MSGFLGFCFGQILGYLDGVLIIATLQQCHEQQKNTTSYIGSLDYSCICMYMYVEKCMSTWAHGIGGLLANTVY